MSQKWCKSCRAENIPPTREARYPGPRCLTHHRAEQKRIRSATQARRTESTYGLTSEDYSSLYEAQGGHCAICQKARGITKRLSVDHEHHRDGCDHPPDRGCYLCIRGLLCAQCNRILIGRYDVQALKRAIAYLTDPPARRTLLGS